MADSTNPASEGEALIRFARRISHDINNYSTVVRTYSELLLADLSAGNPMHADLGEVWQAADSTVNYLQRVTQFARAGTMRRVPTSVNDGITDAIALLQSDLKHRVVDASLSGGVIFADASWWRDCVVELIRNAHEASPDGSGIQVRSQIQGDRVIVDVEDAGVGFSPELLAKSTAPFVTSKQGVRGAGMGLAIVAAFARILQGELMFSRESALTRVRLVLPALSATID